MIVPALIRAQIYYEQNISLGTIPEASEIKGDVILKNQSEKKIFLMRADADQGVKVYTSKKVLQPEDTCLIVISFIPESSGRFKKRIGLVSSDKSTPYEVYVSGTLGKLKRNDATACYYFGARKNNTNAVMSDPVVVNEPDKPRDNSNRLPDSPPVITQPALPKENKPAESRNSNELSAGEYRPNNILFLIDISGSMRDSLKLPLMKAAMHTLIDAVRDIDNICLVTYADSVKIVKEGIKGSDKETLHRIVDGLHAKGLTKGNKAILFSQQLAQKYFIENGNNQILLATDGKFRFYPDDQKTWAQRQGTKKIVMSTVAFGNDRDAMSNLKEIADKGEGSFIHIKKRNGSQEKLLDEIKQRSKR